MSALQTLKLNYQPHPKCVCKKGYANEYGGREVKFGDTGCSLGLTMDTKAGASWIEAKIVLEGDTSEVKKVEIKLQLKGKDGNLVDIAPHHGKHIDFADVTSNGGVIRLNNLPSGKRFALEVIALVSCYSVLNWINLLNASIWSTHTFALLVLESFILQNSDNVSVMGNKRLRTSAVTHCACSDQDFQSEDDITGRPERLMVAQKEGYITFEFQGASRCEEGYAFTRQLGSDNDSNEKQVFTPNYYFVPTKRCIEGSPLIKSGRQAADDLRESDLLVGHNYTFCVRAIARGYMDNPTSETA